MNKIMWLDKQEGHAENIFSFHKALTETVLYETVVRRMRFEGWGHKPWSRPSEIKPFAHEDVSRIQAPAAFPLRNVYESSWIIMFEHVFKIHQSNSVNVTGKYLLGGFKHVSHVSSKTGRIFEYGWLYFSNGKLQLTNQKNDGNDRGQCGFPR